MEVTRSVEEALEALKLGRPGIEMDSALFRPASYLELAVDNLARLGQVFVEVAVGKSGRVI